MKRTCMKKEWKNLLFFVGMTVVILVFLLMRGIFFKQTPETVEIVVDKEVYGSYRLAKKQEILICLPDGSYNCVQIDEGMVWVKEANCAGQDCVHQGKISQTGETIICLPHQLVIRIIGVQEPVYDAISQ